MRGDAAPSAPFAVCRSCLASRNCAEALLADSRDTVLELSENERQFFDRTAVRVTLTTHILDTAAGRGVSDLDVLARVQIQAARDYARNTTAYAGAHRNGSPVWVKFAPRR